MTFENIGNQNVDFFYFIVPLEHKKYTALWKIMPNKEMIEGELQNDEKMELKYEACFYKFYF